MMRFIMGIRRELFSILAFIALLMCLVVIATIVDRTTAIIGLEFFLNLGYAGLAVLATSLARWIALAVGEPSIDGDIDRGDWRRWWRDLPSERKIEETRKICQTYMYLYAFYFLVFSLGRF